jgi:hypothetical protein
MRQFSKSLKDQNALHREIRKRSVQTGRLMIRVSDQFGATLSRIPTSRLVMIGSRAHFANATHPLIRKDAGEGTHELVGVGRGQQRSEPCGDR